MVPKSNLLNKVYSEKFSFYACSFIIFFLLPPKNKHFFMVYTSFFCFQLSKYKNIFVSPFFIKEFFFVFVSVFLLCFLSPNIIVWRSFYNNTQRQSFFKKLFMYLFLAALGLRRCTRAFSSCGEWGLFFVVVHGLSCSIAEHGLQA